MVSVTLKFKIKLFLFVCNDSTLYYLDNVPHEYVYHVIRKIDNNMSLVTRKATPEEVQMVNVMARERMFAYFSLNL